jgi:hypothetical protein
MTDSRQELQTLAASALMVGLHQAIEAYHEAVRGAKAGEHSRVSANAPCSRRWRRQRTRRGHLLRSVPDPPARSRREASSAPMPSDQPDVAEASHPRSVGRQRDHCTPTPPGRWRSQRARHPASPCRRLHRRLGLTHRSTAARQRSAATSPFPSVQNRSRASSPQSTGGVSVRGSPMHVSMRRCLPPNLSPNAQYCRIGRGNLRPPCRKMRLLASQIYAWWLMVFPGAKRRVNHGVA